ncbi:hypothetical protein ANRL1_01427 [Anaerolineae bacterium]|nr:hypothetical protein ANRL1_01427 [Anaerolineae bacterium]
MKRSEILEVMRQIKLLLERHRVKFWAKEFNYLEEDLKNAYASGSNNRKREGLEQILKIFGGMGSFSDLYINEAAGHEISPDEQTSVNQELDKLKSQLYLLVQEERTELNTGE